MTGRRKAVLVTAVATILLLVAAACGDDDTEATPTTTSVEDSASSTSTDQTDDDTTTSEAADTSTTTEPVELTDSFRGVTADTILVGFTTVDFARLNQNFGLELTFADGVPAMEAVVADLNERGGILGRRIELVSRRFVPVGPVEVEAICVELTEDLGVFAVLGGFAGPGAEDVNDCITDTHETIIVGGTPTPQQLARARAPWISNTMERERRARGLVAVLEAEGRLAELGVIGILASTPNDAGVVDAARDAFTAAGTEVAFDAIVSTTGDETATRGEVDVFFERGRAEGVDTFLFIGDDAYANEQLIARSGDTNLLWLYSDSVQGWNTDPPPGLDDVPLLLATGSGEGSRDDPAWGNCIELVDAAYDTEIRPPHELAVGETNHWSALSTACLNVRLFEQVATAAGADLTNESFAAAAAGLGAYELPGSPFASLGPGKPDGLDTVRLTTWDHGAGQWTPISDPFDVTG